MGWKRRPGRSAGARAAPSAGRPGRPGRGGQVSGEQVRDHLANVRTLLARLRGGIVLLGFGYAIEKFTLIEQRPARSLGIAVAVTSWLLTAIAGARFLWQRRVIAVVGRVSPAWWELGLSVLTAAAGVAILLYVAATS